MRTKTINIYTFNELSEKAKKNAIDNYREGMAFEYEYQIAWENILDDAKNIGLKIIALDQHRANEGFFLEDAENVAKKIMKDHGQSCETYKTAKNFLDELAKTKDENDIEELEKEFLHDLLEDFRIMCQKEIEYQESDEAITDSIEANEYEFLENGEFSF